ncbi:MAG: hypothetical protein KKG33_00405 [candidate division Zixibacteria bacterium]|nr:hypothetical protein [candidate division Zixibacteria bacterium]MBU1469905.1 hypothetical protein [candidate division Zixibacteria bacterium]MBU2624000.1 hypothetical protein [candidate division Zixibacteria bacterium]
MTEAVQIAISTSAMVVQPFLELRGVGETPNTCSLESDTPNEMAVSSFALGDSTCFKPNRVLRAKVTPGTLFHTSPDHFGKHFERAAVGTPAHSAKLETKMLTETTDPQAQDIILDSIEVVEE